MEVALFASGQVKKEHGPACHACLLAALCFISFPPTAVCVCPCAHMRSQVRIWWEGGRAP
eukprot:1157811-Pelagomonas_calceolata.AAC.5